MGRKFRKHKVCEKKFKEISLQICRSNCQFFESWFYAFFSEKLKDFSTQLYYESLNSYLKMLKELIEHHHDLFSITFAEKGNLLQKGKLWPLNV